MITKKKHETEGLDNYLRLFPKVMRNANLTLLQKFILCDVISRNIQGEPYYKVSATLADELGNYKKKTIQTAFQWLNSNGYINTEPYNNGKHKDDLREVEIIQIEKWIFTDEHLNKIGFKILPTEKKAKDENYAWIMKNRKIKAKALLAKTTAIDSKNIEPVSVSIVRIEPSENECKSAVVHEINKVEIIQENIGISQIGSVENLYDYNMFLAGKFGKIHPLGQIRINSNAITTKMQLDDLYNNRG